MRKWDAAIIGTAIIWASVIAASVPLIAGTPNYAVLLSIEGGGAALNLIVLAGGRPRRVE